MTSPAGKAAAPQRTVALVSVRIGSVIQPGFSETKICKQASSGVECDSAILHQQTDTVISIGGRWISSCRADARGKLTRRLIEPGAGGGA